MAHMLFDDRTRTLQGGSRPGDLAFAYLDQSARPEAARIRALLNAFVERYPEADRAALIARIRREDSHLDAAFELLVHEWCLRAGMRVLAIEPAVPGTSRRPDFLVESLTGERFYLECAVSRGESNAEAGARTRRDEVMRAIDHVRSPDFMLAIDTNGVPGNPIRRRALTARIEAWLNTLEHGQIAATPLDEVPRYDEDLDGMQISLRPIARGGSRGGAAQRATGIASDGVRVSAPWETIREKLIEKATRYGTPDLPLVVAVNAGDRDFEIDDAMDSLYGSDAYFASSDGTGRMGRLRDGVWHGPNGPQCTKLSAVLVTRGLCPWTLGQRDAVFIENAWTKRSASFVDFRTEAWRCAGGVMRHRDGQSVQEIFGVPRDWPETFGAETDP
jgi:hypothetical protein